MPNPADRNLDSIPNLHDLDMTKVPPSVLRSVLGRLQASDLVGAPVSAFENFVGEARAELPDAA